MEEAPMILTDFDALTFDCYGTLIDWETGITAAVGAWLEGRGAARQPDAVLEAFADIENRLEADHPSLLYSDLLAAVLKEMGGRWGIACDDAEAAAFGASVPDWPAFADSAQALRTLKGHFKLVILSNVDRDSFAGSNRRLGAPFDRVLTAQDIGSYKPDPRNFETMVAALADMGVEKSRILHVAQSRFHDHVPAKKMGLATAWIDRRHAKSGTGATQAAEDVWPDFTFTSLAGLVEAHQAALAERL